MSISKEWLNRIPDNSLEGAVTFLNDLDWNITFITSKATWKVFGGDRLLFTSINKDEVKAFIFGMALTLSVLPNEIIDRIKEIISE
jgi:hypothetical protein